MTRNTRSKPFSEINVTPFVDEMLVLLIIFMVTAPLLTVGVQVDLPESSADSLPEEQEPLTLTINSKGEIFIQESKVEYENIVAKILRLRRFIHLDKVSHALSYQNRGYISVRVGYCWHN